MAPRLEVLQRLGTIKLCLRPPARPVPPLSLLPVVQRAGLSQREKKRLANKDPYRWAQAQQRKNANLKRRAQLEKERSEALGDPVLGNTTPFLESLDWAGQEEMSRVKTDGDGNPIGGAEPHKLPTSPGLRSYGLTDAELDDAAKHAFVMTKPLTSSIRAGLDVDGDEEMQQHERTHKKALLALRRITSLDLGGATDRFHANVRRIVDEFGRHKTDKFLEPKPPSIRPNTVPMPGRAGPDTGSSEVQIAILTAKIRALHLASKVNRGYKDRQGPRKLRLLVHRRQKLLKYMERKERGSGRWTHMLEKLGLTPAAWKGEITV
ncbi:hypothetical protein CDD83_6755 [Cordyceps sp. RAO-2017]|nr:hypothetical protein CDD83_6755 [Cordyceps sp. RAO-2017]